MSTDPDAKVLFRIAGEHGHVEVETLWAVALGNDRYQLDNSPFYAYSVSWKDVVHAPFCTKEGRATFERVISKSGHKTVRIILDPAESDSESSTVLQGLTALGCSYEGAARRLFSIDVPPEVALEDVRRHLIDHHVQWEHADPSYEELYPNEA